MWPWVVQVETDKSDLLCDKWLKSLTENFASKVKTRRSSCLHRQLYFYMPSSSIWAVISKAGMTFCIMLTMWNSSLITENVFFFLITTASKTKMILKVPYFQDFWHDQLSTKKKSPHHQKTSIFSPLFTAWFWLPAETEAVWRGKNRRRSQHLAGGVVIHLGEASVRHYHPLWHHRGMIMIIFSSVWGPVTGQKSSHVKHRTFKNAFCTIQQHFLDVDDSSHGVASRWRSLSLSCTWAENSEWHTGRDVQTTGGDATASKRIRGEKNQTCTFIQQTGAGTPPLHALLEEAVFLWQEKVEVTCAYHAALI